MLKRLIFLVFIFAAYTSLSCDEYTVIEDKGSPTFQKPLIEKIKIKLKNDLEAYIISDPAAEQSAASLTVLTGSWEDPLEHPGLAHFLEHMLFLGTKKYPNESEFDRFVSEHGGTKNAYTADDNTTFFFSTTNDAFEEGLDRFSDFFKNPLFNPSGVNRELQAIDQEYAKNIQTDEIRLVQVLKELSVPTHPYHNFSMGNSKTLSSVAQETLKAWYHEHYSANLMRLIIVSPLSLDKLKEWVVQDFGDIPNHNETQQHLQLPLFNKDLSGKIVYIEPIKNKRTLTFVWDLPSQFASMLETQPDAIVSHLLGHESEGTLLSELKKEKLAEAIRCGSDHAGPGNLVLFLQIDLTDEGVKQVDQVVLRCFQTIAFYKKQGIPESVFTELQRILSLEYQYQPRESASNRALELAMKIPYEKMNSFPEYTYVIQRFDPAAVSTLLDYLTPQNSIIMLMAPEKITDVKPENNERWISVPYTVKPVPAIVWNSWIAAEPYTGIEIPSQNRYLPTNVNLLPLPAGIEAEKTILPKPEEVLQNEKGVFYFAQDTRFNSPKVCWMFQIKTPAINQGNIQSVVLGDLYERWITEALSSESYPAIVAGLNYEIKRSENGLTIQIDGYSENAALLLDTILKKFLEAIPTKESYATVRTSLMNKYQDAAMNSPYEQAMESAQSVLYKYYFTDDQKAVTLRRMSFEKFQQFTSRLFDNVFIEGMFYGNMNKQQARSIADNMSDTFTGDSYPKGDQLKQQTIILPKSEGPFYVEQKITAQGNTTLLAIETPDYTFKNRGAQQILMQGMSDAFFAELRTKQQTGYLVFSAPLELEKRLFNLFLVQSNTHDVRDLLARFELFLEGYLQEIRDEISEERFENIRLSIIQTMESSATNTKSMTELLNMLAFKYDADFSWVDQRVEALKTLTYEEFLTIASEMIGRTNRQRFALLMQGTNTNEQLLHYKQLPTLQRLRAISTY